MNRCPAIERSRTPILDQIVPAPGSDLYWDSSPASSGVFTGIVFLLIGLVVWIGVFQNNLWFGANVAMSGLYLIAAWYPSCLVHELGHVAVGLVLRRRLVCLRVGPLRLARKERRMQVQFDPKNWMPGGLVQCIPSRSGVSRAGEAAFCAAGPIATVALFVAALNAFPLSRAHVPGWEVPLLCIAAFSTVTSLLPYSSDSEASDGAVLLSLFGKRGIARCAFTDVIGAVSRNEYPAAAVIEKAASDATTTIAYLNANFVAYLLTVPYDFQRGMLYLEAALTRCDRAPISVRAKLFREAAYIQARRKRFELARDWFQRAEALDQTPAQERATRGATLIPSEIRSRPNGRR